MPSRKLSVLGCGPFTLALIEALADAASTLPAFEVSLHGRSADDLRAIAGYADRRLTPYEWTVSHTVDLDASLEGSDVVVQQIRFGGLDGRAADEAVAAACGLAADETLGPAAVHCLLRTADQVKALGAAIARGAPRAWILNLTNPLSISTALFAREGVDHVAGVCELPTTTAMRVAAVLGCDVADLTWDYVGFNHRGFVVRLARDGEDVLPALVDRLQGGSLEGIAAATIGALHAVPTKYFQLLLAPPPAPQESRARYLHDLKRRIMGELRAAPDRPPASLSLRRTDWYELSVVPLLRGLSGSSGADLVVNATTAAGLVEEGIAHVSRDGVAMRPRPPSLSPDVERWLELFRDHERALLALALEANADHIRAAVDRDPSIPESLRLRVTDHLVRAGKRQSAIASAF